MDSRILQVLNVCLPVFALIGLGKALERRGAMNADHRQFVNWLVFHFALPALVFRGVARQELADLLNPALAIGALLPVAIVALVFLALRPLFGYQGGFAAVFVFGSFWANISYIGFPLAQNAFGDNGFAAAAVYNAFALPAFLILGFLIIGGFGAGDGPRSLAATLKKAFFNPIVMSALFGMAVAAIGRLLRAEEGGFIVPGLAELSGLANSFLALLGGMGLPLALLSIGAALKLEHARGFLLPLSLITLGKLVLVPAISLAVFRLVLPLFGMHPDPVVVGVTVLLSAMPNAVGSYVVACQIGVEEDFVSTMLVVTTCLSVVTIPVWLYFVL
jgi:hypothetical protein